MSKVVDYFNEAEDIALIKNGAVKNERCEQGACAYVGVVGDELAIFTNRKSGGVLLTREEANDLRAAFASGSLGDYLDGKADSLK